MTSSEVMILGKLALTFGCLIGIPAWELVQLRRERRRMRADEAGNETRPQDHWRDVSPSPFEPPARN